MKTNLLARILMAATPVMIAGCLLASSATAMAQSGDRHCSDQTLLGDYGFTIEGVILGPNLPVRGLDMAHFDGQGSITQVDHIVTNGIPPAEEWTPGTGTYTVNPDCTGVAVINSGSTPFPLNLHFVVVRQGKEIHQVVDKNAVTAVGIRVE